MVSVLALKLIPLHQTTGSQSRGVKHPLEWRFYFTGIDHEGRRNQFLRTVKAI